MGRNPKCKYCGKEVDRLIAFEIKVGGKNHYYCNKNEYLLQLEKQEKREELINLLVDATNAFGDSGRLYVKSAILSLEKKYQIADIIAYLKYDLDRIQDSLRLKNISEISGRVKYAAAIIRNHIDEYLQSRNIKNTKEPVEVDFYFSPNNYKPSKQRRSMAEIERLGDTDVDE